MLRARTLFGVAALIIGLGACTFADCEGIKDKAYAMVEAARPCSPDHECVKVSYYDLMGEHNCLGAFLCEDAFGAHVDLEAFAAIRTFTPLFAPPRCSAISSSFM